MLQDSDLDPFLRPGAGSDEPAAASVGSSPARAPSSRKYNFDAITPEIADAFKAAAQAYGVDENVLIGIAAQESGFNPKAIGPVTSSGQRAVGLMQFMPDTAKRYGIDPTDPIESIVGAAAYMRNSLDKFGGDYRKAIASYNWGENRKAFDEPDWENRLPPETKEYLGYVSQFMNLEAERNPRQELPAGVKPSEAGGGRGFVNPPMVDDADLSKPFIGFQGPTGGKVAPRSVEQSEAMKGLQSGAIGLKQMWESNKVLVDSTAIQRQSEALALFDKADAGTSADDIKRTVRPGKTPTYAQERAIVYASANPQLRQQMRDAIEQDIAGRTAFVDASLATIRQYQADQQRVKGRVDEFTDIKSLKDFQDWLVFNGASGIVSMAPLLIAAATTGGAAPVVTGALGYGMATGELAGDRIKAGEGANAPGRFANPDRQDQATPAANAAARGYVAKTADSTYGAAAPFAALDVLLGPTAHVLARTLMKRAGQEPERLTVKGAIKETGKGTAEEFAAGGGQESIKVGAEVGLGEQENFTTPENAKRIFNSAMAEAAGGLVGGAGVSGVRLAAQAPKTDAQKITDIGNAKTMDDVAAAAMASVQAPPSSPPAQAAADNLAGLIQDRIIGKTSPDIAATTDAITALETQNAGTAGNAGVVDSGATAGPGDQAVGGVGAAGLGDAVRGASGGNPEVAVAGVGRAESVPQPNGERPAGVEPAKVWYGRRGDGYLTPEDAQRGLGERQRLQGQFDWRIEPTPDGKYRLAGYAPSTAGGTVQASAPAYQSVNQSPITFSQGKGGSWFVGGDPATIRDLLRANGITNFIPTRGGAQLPASTDPEVIGAIRMMAEDIKNLSHQELKDDIRKRMGLDQPKEKSPAGSPFRSFLRNFGIKPELRADITGESNGFRANARLPKTFRADGLNIDELAQRAVEYGFMRQSELDDPNDNGGANRLIAMIQAEIRGVRQMTVEDMNESNPAEEAAQAEVMGRLDRMGVPVSVYRDMTPAQMDRLAKRIGKRLERARLNRQAIEVAEEARLEREAIQAADDLLPADLSAIDRQGLKMKEATLEDFMRSMLFSEQEIRDELAKQANAAQSPQAPDEADARGPQGSGQAGQGDPVGEGPRAEGQVGQDLFGTAPNASQQEANRIRQEREDRERAQQQSAQPPNEFTLTGSDRAADVGDARGQGDLLAPTGESEQAAARKPDAAPFDSEAWDKARADRIKASREAGNVHLDTLPKYVESMRGKAITYVHDTKERGRILSVDNRGNVYVEWLDDYSRGKEMATPMDWGKRKGVMTSSLGPSDLKDYYVVPDQPATSATKDAQQAAPAEKDYFSELFGTPEQQADAQAKFEADAQAKKRGLSSVRTAIADQQKRAKSEYDEWAGRQYKQNKTQVDLRGDGPGNQASMSIGSINESRRRNAMESLAQEIGALDKMADEASTDIGAERLAGRLADLYRQASKIASDGTGLFKTADEQFEYMLLDDLKFRGPSGKGNVTSNGLSKAALAVIRNGAIKDAQPAPSEPVQEGGAIDQNSNLPDGTTIKDGNGNLYRVHYQRNGLVIAHPILDGKPVVSKDTSVRFWVDNRGGTPSGDSDRTDPIYRAQATGEAAPGQENDRDSFTLQRLNRETDKMESITFRRGEYVTFKVGEGGKQAFGEIDGISHAKREFSVDGLWYDFGFAYKAERPAPAKKDTVPMSTVVDAVNKKHGGGLGPADAVSIVDAFKGTMRAVYDGTASIDDYKTAYGKVRDAEKTKAELGKMTKDELIRTFGIMVRPDEKKDGLVATAYKSMLRSFALGKEYGSRTYLMTRGGLENYERQQAEALDAIVANHTADDLAAFAAEVKAAREERDAKRSAAVEAIKNPKTLDEYRQFMSYHTRDGKSTAEVRLTMLKPEQRAEFDLMLAEESRGRRKVNADEQRTQVRVAGQTVDGNIIATKHTKKGHDLFVVQLSERVSREDYETLNTGAKKIGGYYSSFRGGGAIPGFQFTTREQAQAFVTLAGGDATAAKEAAQERRDAYADDRSQTAAERLTEMANAIEEAADESLNRERKANTARRARFAAAAEAGAREAKAMAKTMRNVAEALTNGSAKFLDRIRTKKQVELLQTYVANAKDAELRAKYQTYAEQEKRKGQPPTQETADYAEFPEYTAYRSDLASLGRQLQEVDGTKKLGDRLMKVADDVSDAFTAWAKEPGNLFKLSTFSVRSGEDVKTAIFRDRETAERAIKRSGLSGKAIVFPEKRGVNRIIMSPSEAIAKGIWTGDGDKRITLNEAFGAEIVEGIGRAAKRGSRVNDRLNAPWQFERAYERRKQLASMGIETPAEFRSALREFIGLREQAAEADKIKAMERAMIGRAKDGLDFFPTPEAVADEMIAAADIRPDMAVLEPSAGIGHIADRIRSAGAEPDVIEMDVDRRELLQEKGYHLAPVNDFLQLEPRKFFTYGDVFRAPDGTEGVMTGLGSMGSRRVVLKPLVNGEEIDYRRGEWYDRDELVGVRHRGVDSGYDRIIMNPPFSDGRDIEHVRHAYTLLKPGGRIVALMGESAFTNQNKRATEFREWLESVGGTEEKLPDGSFMDPSLPVNTGANARMVVIDKPEAGALDAPALSRSGSTPFYSSLRQSIEKINAKALPPGLWKDGIRGLLNKGAVKADEVEWSGLSEWLDLQQGKVTKDQVLAFLDANGVRVEEVTLGGIEAKEGAREVIEAAGYIVEDDGSISRESEDGDYESVNGWDLETRELRDAAALLADAPDGYAGSSGVAAPKYDKYTLPGGTNYREVLLTLPTDAKPVTGEVRHDPAGDAKYQWAIIVNGKEVNRSSSEALAPDILEEELTRARKRAAKDGNNYKSSHWDQPNVLAHIRLNDRTDADGNRVLFVEEVQSDWGQQAKRVGFRDESVVRLAAEKKEAMRGAFDAAQRRLELARAETNKQSKAQLAEMGLESYSQIIGAGAKRAELTEEYRRRQSEPRWAAAIAALREAEAEVTRISSAMVAAEQEGDQGGKLPLAPFVTSTDKWLTLALKRIMVMAAQEGYDRVAFINGEQSAERYSLDKHVGSVTYVPGMNGGTLLATDLGDNSFVIKETNVTPEKVADFVGKDVAEKLMAQPIKDGSHKLTGSGLKVPQGGMRAFYDTIVPNTLKPLLKKVGGGQLDEVTIDQGGLTSARIGAPDDAWPFVVYVGDREVNRVGTRDIAEEEVADLRARGKNARYVQRLSTETQQPGFTITPEMRERLVGGMPLFRAQGQTGGMSVEAARKIIDAKVAKWTNGPRVVVVATPKDLPMQAPDDANGVYHQGTAYIVAGAHRSPGQVLRTLAHEAVAHYGLRGMLGDGYKKFLAQMQMAIKMGNKPLIAIRDDVRSRYRDEDGRYNLTELQEADEIAARAIEMGLDENGEFKTGFGWLKSWFAKLAQFLRELGILIPVSNLELQGMLVNAQRFVQGRSAEAVQGDAVPAMSRTGTINVDGVERSRTNSEGQQIHPTEDGIRNFWRWFKDSAVVDEQGRPLVVYHGTTAEVSAFDATKVKERFPNSEGFYFTSRGLHASVYADSINNAAEGFNPNSRFIKPAAVGGNVMPVYVSLQNPKAITVSDWGTLESAVDGDGGKRVRAAREAGHDGVIVKRRAGDEYDGNLVIAFRPNQVKSATGNTGAFSAGNDDIAFSRGGEADPVIEPTRDIKSDGPGMRWIGEEGRYQFAPGAWLWDVLGKKAGPLLAWAHLKAPSKELREIMREMKLKVQQAQDTAVDVAKAAAQLSDTEREMVSDIIERELKAGTVPPEHAVRLAATMNAAMNRQTDELIELGMLSRESADIWRGQYLPRFYEGKLAPGMPEPWAKAMRKLTGNPNALKGMKGNHLRGRGMYEVINESDLPSWEKMGWQVRDPGYNPSIPTEDGKVQVWRDYTRQERDKMGEIRDAGFRFVMGYMQMQKDIALGRMFERIASDPEMSSRLPSGDMTVQVPSKKIAGTGVEVYGKLAGRYVSKETLSQLTGIEESHSDAWTMYRKALGIWKEGKALALNTPIPTPDGWTTMGEIKPGDTVFDEQGKPCLVIYATGVQLDRECFEVEFSDGCKIVADAEHLWFTNYHSKGSVKTTRQILDTLKERTRGDNNHSIPVAGPLDLPEQWLPVPPYALGAWLGDGRTDGVEMCAGSKDAEQMMQLIREAGLVTGAPYVDKRNGVVTWGLRYADASLPRKEGLQPTMRAMGLLGNKHIPAAYLRASEAQRRELLCGLMDTDGHVTEEGKCEFATTLPRLRDDIMELLRSLGYKPVAGQYVARVGGKNCGDHWRVKFQAYADKPCFKMVRKVARLRQAPETRQRSGTRQIVAIRPVQSVPVKCIQVDSESRLYLAGDGMIPTHNTALNPVAHANNIISNVSMAHFAGVSMHRADKYLAAMRDFASKSTKIKEAKDAGLFLGTISEAELYNALPKELQELANRAESVAEKVGGTALNLLSFYLRKPMGWAYQAEDTFFRYLIYRDARERGMDPSDAVDYAQRYIFTYDDLPQTARRIRDFGIPFFAYTYKAVPALLHTALHHPDRMVLPAAVLWGVNAAAYAIAAGDDDESWDIKLKRYLTDPDYREKARKLEQMEREHLPIWQKGMTALGTPKTIRLGMDEVTKLPIFLDASRIVPGGDMLDVENNAGGVPWIQPLTPNHPLLSIYSAMMLNKDGYFGRELVDANDTRSEAAAKRADWMWKQLTPAIAFGNYHFERVMNAIAQATGEPVRWLPEMVSDNAVATGVARDGLPVQPKYAAMQTFGIKARPVDLESAEAIDESKKQQLIRGIDIEMKRLQRMTNKGAVADSVYESAAEKAQVKKDRLREGLTVDGDKR